MTHAPHKHDRVNQPVHIHGTTSDRYSWLRLKKVAHGQWSKAAAYVYESDAALGKKWLVGPTDSWTGSASMPAVQRYRIRLFYARF